MVDDDYSPSHKNSSIKDNEQFTVKNYTSVFGAAPRVHWSSEVCLRKTKNISKCQKTKTSILGSRLDFCCFQCWSSLYDIYWIFSRQIQRKMFLFLIVQNLFSFKI